MKFDHVALAAFDVRPALETFVSDMGATVIGGGSPGAFRALQLRVGDADDGMTVELLEPWDTTLSDFLVRFLDRHGAGPHHLTFKTDDLLAEHRRLIGLGFNPVGLQNSSSTWREFFLHPAESPGTVIQIAQLMRPERPLAERLVSMPQWSEPWWPEYPRGREPAVLDRVVLGTPTPEATCHFFAHVLGGDADEGGSVVSWGRDRLYLEPADRAGILRLEVRGLAEPAHICGIDLVPF